MTKAQQTQVERAMVLAKKAGHKVYTGHSRQTGETVYTVKSRSQQNTFHILYIRQGRIICDCYAHQHGEICSHAGAVRMFLVEQREALKAIEAQEAKDEQPEEVRSVTTPAPGRLSCGHDRSALMSPDENPRCFLCGKKQEPEHDKATALLADNTFSGSIFKPEGARARVVEEW